jgi:phenylpropionate dioxygenase-like ring-hydroxylating dioxygenase large terminal subunit
MAKHWEYYSEQNKQVDPDYGHDIISKERYVSEEFMDLEKEHIWKKIWLLGGPLLDLKESGDYITTEILDESILIMKGEDNKIRAFYNVCQHRGNQLVHSPTGNAKQHKCSFHAWAYNSAGTLINVPDEETFAQGAPCEKLSLKELPCDIWGGFAWFSLNKDVEPLMEFLGIIPEHLDPYHFEKMQLVNDVTVEMPYNWKTSVDAFNETYHVVATHPELTSWLEDLDIQIDVYDKHNRYIVPFGTPSSHLEDKTTISDDLRLYMEQAGIDSNNFKGDATEVRRAIQIQRREHGAEMGYDFSELNDDQLSDDFHYLIFPNITLNIYPESMMLFRQRPHPTDPNKSFFDLQNYLMQPGASIPGVMDNQDISGTKNEEIENSKDEVSRKRRMGGTYQEIPTEIERPLHRQFKHGEESLGVVLDQDAYNLPHVQKGMNSEGYEGLWLGTQELRIRHFHQTIDDYVFKNKR